MTYYVPQNCNYLFGFYLSNNEEQITKVYFVVKASSTTPDASALFSITGTINSFSDGVVDVDFEITPDLLDSGIIAKKYVWFVKAIGLSGRAYRQHEWTGDFYIDPAGYESIT